MELIPSPFLHDTDAAMLETEVISEQWSVQVGLNQRFHGNKSYQSGVVLLEAHTLPTWKRAKWNLSNILNVGRETSYFYEGIWLVGL